jgi:hypothetical protein
MEMGCKVMEWEVERLMGENVMLKGNEEEADGAIGVGIAVAACLLRRKIATSSLLV